MKERAEDLQNLPVDLPASNHKDRLHIPPMFFGRKERQSVVEAGAHKDFPRVLGLCTPV
jgi:hypothetical protein